MSKRFGRNQKRRMRQETQALDELRTRDQQAITNLRERIEEHRGFLEYVLDIVGHGSILNPVPHPLVWAGGNGQMRIPVLGEPLNIWSPSSVESIQTTILHALGTRIILDRMRGSLHFLASMRNGDVAYALTNEAIATMSTQRLTAVLHKHIARQLAHQLALELKR